VRELERGRPTFEDIRVFWTGMIKAAIIVPRIGGNM